jgi:hypothetical protein
MTQQSAKQRIAIDLTILLFGALIVGGFWLL